MMEILSGINWGLALIAAMSLFVMFKAKQMVDEQERERAEKKRSENG